MHLTAKEAADVAQHAKLNLILEGISLKSSKAFRVLTIRTGDWYEGEYYPEDFYQFDEDTLDALRGLGYKVDVVRTDIFKSTFFKKEFIRIEIESITVSW